jgi:SulP family sulfate permease
LLLLVAWNMSEVKHFAHALRVAPKSDVAVLLLCFGLTVIFDMVVSVTVGVVLAALLFMRRMAEVSNVRLVDQHPLVKGLPKDVLVYEVAGPLFFGAAQKAMSALQRVPTGISAVLLDLSSVPAMDATGLVSLEGAVERLQKMGIYVILAGVQMQPMRVLAKSGVHKRRDRIAVYGSMERAVAAAQERSRISDRIPAE